MKAKKSKKADRKEKRLDNKRYVEKGTFDVEVDRESYPVKGRLTTKRKRGDSYVTKFKARGSKDTPIKKVSDKKKIDLKSGFPIVKKDKKSTKYRVPKY